MVTVTAASSDPIVWTHADYWRNDYHHTHTTNKAVKFLQYCGM